MKVSFHPEFANDILRFEAGYTRVSVGLARRFRSEIDQAIDLIVRSPGRAGHYLQLESETIHQLRRRNLKSFPFFVLYGYTKDQLVFGSVIPSRLDPLTWLVRFKE